MSPEGDTPTVVPTITSLIRCQTAMTPSEGGVTIKIEIDDVRGGRQIWDFRTDIRWLAPQNRSTRRSRKEVIQPQVPLRLPCYDFTPITRHTVGSCLPCGLAHRLQVHLTFVV